MSLGYPNQNGGRTTDAALFHSLGNIFTGTWVSGFRVRQNSPLDMSVRIGGDPGTPDDLLVRDDAGTTFPVCNLSAQPVVAVVSTANSANPRIDTVVVYIDASVAANHTAANNENRTKIAVVAGTPATNPSAPSASQIKSVVGANSPYVVLADIRVNRGVTSISDANITHRREAVQLLHAPVISNSNQISNDIVLPQHMSAVARGDYTSAEVDTGRKWIDGKTVYQKTIDFGQLPSGGERVVSLGIVQLGQIVSVRGIAVHDNKTALSIPYTHPNPGLSVAVYINSSGALGLQTGVDRRSYRGYVTIEYTKD